MTRPTVSSGGGFKAVAYIFQKGREAGSVVELYKRLRSRNACKTCALGMGGQSGGMVNETGHFPSVCKKSIQAQASDMTGVIEESFFQHTSIDAMARLSSAEFERLGRLTFPIVAEPGATHFRRIGWDEALDRTAVAFRDAPRDEAFVYASGRSSNEAAFLLQLVARAYGTPNIHNCSFYCHAASGVALSQIMGSGTASVTLDDLEKADIAVVAGANPASNHPRLITELMKLRRRGGKVIVINPLKELGLLRFRVPSDPWSLVMGSTISDLYLMPHVGGDVAVAKALLKGVIEADAVDREYVGAYTAGWDAVESDVRATSWDVLVRESGLSRADIDAAVALLAGAKRGLMLWAMGLTHHVHGVDNILALANLALARGWLGRPGAGLVPIRGHSNVQGVGTCGVSPTVKEAFAAKLEEVYGISVPREPGQDTYASMVAAEQGRIRAALLFGGNLFASNPDREWAGAAMRRIALSCSITTKLNEGHVHGRGQTAIVLPALARDEESQWTTQESMFNYVRLSEGGTPNVEGEMRSEVEILAALAERILPAGKFDWSALRSHKALREAMAKVMPALGELAEIDRTKKEFVIAGRTFHEPRFETPDGLAHFAVTPLPELPFAEGDFRLMTLRSEGQFNTVVYEEEDLYRGNKHRNVVMLSAADAARLGVKEGDLVTVETAIGSMTVEASITDIRDGNLAMYYPEANALVPRQLDPRSKTPAFKSVPARVRVGLSTASPAA
ncbi:MAG: FdhF/YdeP family oxidoreductase [Deltaproteobacteria bacterium]|nr:FdhF/YdeP family oxidoreductase [Deltaproteobacteria bacterium]